MQSLRKIRVNIFLCSVQSVWILLFLVCATAVPAVTPEQTGDLPDLKQGGKGSGTTVRISDVVVETSENFSLPFTEQEEDVLAPGDSLSIKFNKKDKHDDFNGTYQVDTDGNLVLPNTGKILVAGIPLSSLQDDLQKLLGEQLKLDFPVKIKLVARNRFLKIRKGVKYPGWYTVDQDASVDEIARFAGGLLAGVDTDSATIIRNGIRLPYSRALPLHSFDILFLETDNMKTPVVDNGDLLYVVIPKEVSIKDQPTEKLYFKEKVEVDRYGYIFLPTQGNILVAGMTAKEISQQLTDNLPMYLSKSDHATVNIIEKRHYIQVLGQVKKPGWHNVSESANILSCINEAGGLVDGAVMSRITIFRRVNAKSTALIANLYQYSVTGDERMLPVVHENDAIFVPIAASFGTIKRSLGSWSPPDFRLDDDDTAKIRIFGAVQSPGLYEPKKDMTLLDLIIAAGGGTGDVDLSNTLIIRDKKTIKCNVKQLIEQNKEIPRVRAGDIVQIGRMEKSGYKTKTSKDKARIFGAVHKAGGYVVTKEMTLLDLLTQAGGETANADLSNVVILRKKGGIEIFNMKKIFEQQNRSDTAFPRIYRGDTVKVNFLVPSDYREKTTKDKVRIIGAIAKAGSYVHTKDMNLLDLIVTANGETPSADLTNIVIIRADNTTMTFNMRKLLDNPGKSGYKDFPLINAGDTVKIGFLRGDTYREKAGRDKVRIFGAIARAGSYNYRKNMNLMDLIVEANGETSSADLSNIKILRTDGTSEFFNMKRALNQEESKSIVFPKLAAGDTVHLGHLIHKDIKTKSDKKKVRIFGAIARPDGYEVEKDMTLVDLITEAGGETLYADLTKIVIFRPGGGSEEFDLKSFLTGSGGGEGNLPLLSGGEAVHIPYQKREGFVYEQSITVTGPGSSGNGIYPFEPPMTVMKAIARAGGLGDFADTEHIMIVRRINGKQENIPFNYEKGIRGLVPESNILLRPDDIVYVP